MFKDGCRNVYDEKQSRRPSILTEAMVAQIDDKIQENRRLTITELLMKFPQLHVLYSMKL